MLSSDFLLALLSGRFLLVLPTKFLNTFLSFISKSLTIMYSSIIIILVLATSINQQFPNYIISHTAHFIFLSHILP